MRGLWIKRRWEAFCLQLQMCRPPKWSLRSSSPQAGKCWNRCFQIVKKNKQDVNGCLAGPWGPESPWSTHPDLGDLEIGCRRNYINLAAPLYPVLCWGLLFLLLHFTLFLTILKTHLFIGWGVGPWYSCVGWRELVGNSFLPLPPCGLQRLKSSHQNWQQAFSC